MSFLLVCLTRVWSCSYASPGAMEKLKLRSSGVENVCVLIDFIYENDLVALGRKSLVKKGGLALGRWYPFKKKIERTWAWKKKVCLKRGWTRTWAMASVWGKKLNAHGRENNKVWWVEIDFKRKTNIRPKAKCLPRFQIFGEASGVYPSFPFSSARKKNCFIIFSKNLIERQILLMA